MNAYLSDLLERTLDKSDEGMLPYDSSKTIRWQALREAEKLADICYIPQLIEFIDSEKDKAKRDKAYFILGKIAGNINDITATRYLVGRIDKETDTYILSSLLDTISCLNKPNDIDIHPIIKSINSKDWQVRRSALSALKYTDNVLAESILIDILKNSEIDEYDLVYAHSTLSNIGTQKSVPYLTKFVSHKKQDISSSALNAIISISDETCLPLCLEQLDRGKNKAVALEGVIKFGDEEVVPNIIKRIKELVAKQRQIQVIVEKGNKTELIAGMEFLLKYSERVEVKKLFEFVLTKKYDLLWEQEKEWLHNNT